MSKTKGDMQYMKHMSVLDFAANGFNAPLKSFARACFICQPSKTRLVPPLLPLPLLTLHLLIYSRK